MSFNFWACSQKDGIVFSYNNYQNAIYVYREDGKIKEREVLQEELDQETKLRRNANKIISGCIKGGILIFLELILVNVFKVKMSYIWLLYISSSIFYISYIINKNIEEAAKTSKTLKQYHSAEHIVYNSQSTTMSVEELREFSEYANDCGRNDDSVKIFNFILTGVLTNVFCSTILLSYAICYYIVIYIFYIAILNMIYYAVEEARKKGLFNHIFQPLFLEEPTDEQLELAIYGIKRVQELEKEKSN